jgi:hypothetical protein
MMSLTHWQAFRTQQGVKGNTRCKPQAQLNCPTMRPRLQQQRPPLPPPPTVKTVRARYDTADLFDSGGAGVGAGWGRAAMTHCWQAGGGSGRGPHNTLLASRRGACALKQARDQQGNQQRTTRRHPQPPLQ